MPEGSILVTGASRGIGAAIASEFAARGYTVAGLTRSGQSVAGKGYRCDVSDEVSIKAAVAAVAGEGPIAGLVNNAGLYEESDSASLSAADFERLMRNNATSVLMAAREVYPHLKARGGGLIVNIGSFFDKIGVKRNLAYCASKAAVGAITRCLAVEWANRGIRVLDVAPGYIVTDLNRDAMTSGPLADYLKKRIPSGATGKPADVARLVAAIFGEDIPFLSGETIYIDGAQGINH